MRMCACIECVPDLPEPATKDFATFDYAYVTSGGRTRKPTVVYVVVDKLGVKHRSASKQAANEKFPLAFPY